MNKKSLATLVVAPILLLTVGIMVLAQTPTPTPTPTLSPTPSPTPKPKLKEVDLPCMKAAVEKRETAIQTAFNTYSDSINSALQTRKTDLLAAWTITDRKQRNAAIQAAWTKFKQAKKEASKTFKNAKNAAWDQYGVERRACKFSTTGEYRGFDLSF